MAAPPLSETPGPKKVLHIGVIGLGEIAQVSHISVLNNLSSHFLITYLCDPSPSALAHCARKVASNTPPKTTSNPETLISSHDVDVVLLCNATAFHPSHAILALKYDKYVLVEKPLALNYRDLDSIIEAEETSKGKVFVGYQRRYAQAFLDAVKEVGGMEKIQYSRVRDIIGPNSVFVGQSGTFPKKYTDFKKEDSEEMIAKDGEAVKEALTNCGVEATPAAVDIYGLLGSLGSHDLSAMREIIGMPKSVLGASLSLPIWSVLFQYDGFPVTYESGINSVPIFDAHIEIYSHEKIVRVNYDTPYVKGLPVTMTIRERIDGTRGDGYQERIVRKTYEDPYTLEFLQFYKCVTENSTPKTTAVDARQDLDIFKMIMQAGTFMK